MSADRVSLKNLKNIYKDESQQELATQLLNTQSYKITEEDIVF